VREENWQYPVVMGEMRFYYIENAGFPGIRAHSKQVSGEKA